ncbi:MAG: tetratricopeptide repeat protein [Elusimicrobia bacterium]|nr:tetratricopeptide repeat protein [Elusimicrobiota bacterium]
MNKTIIDVCRKIMLYFTPIFYLLMADAFYLRTYDSCQIKITICQVGGTILMTVFFIKLIESWKNPFPKGSFHLILPVTLFLLSGTLSASISPLKNWFVTYDEFSRRVFYIFLFYIIVSEFRSEKHQRRLVNWFLAGAFIAVFYGIIQFFDRFYPPNPATGLDPFIWRQAFSTRIFSTFGNPNFYGDFLLVVAPIILSFVFVRFSKFMILFYISTVFCIIFTYSKAAWIAYSAGVIAFSFFAVAFLAHGKKETIRKVLIGMSLAVFTAMVIGVLILTIGRVDSVRFRTATWLGTWEMFNRTPQPGSYLYDRSPLKSNNPVERIIHPLIGSGIGTFKAVYPAYRRPEVIQLEGRSNTESDHPENEFIELLYDEGIIGFGIFVLIIITFMTAAVNRLKTAQPQSKFVIHGLIGFSSGVISQLTHNFMCVSMRFVSEGVVFWLALGMIGILSLPQVPSSKNIIVPQKQKPKFMNVVQIGILLLCIYFVKYFCGFFMADVYHNIAIFNSKRGDWSEALRNYEIVLKYNPDYVMTHYFMGNVYNDRGEPGDLERAINKYNDVLKLAPNYVQIFMQMGMVHSKMGKWQDAIADYRKYQKLDPVFERSYQSLGMAYAQVKDWKNAEDTFKRFIARNDWFYYYLTLITMDINTYNNLVKYHILRPDAWLNLGNIYFAQKKVFAAEAMYNKILKDIDPNNADAIRNLGIIYEKTGRNTQAQNLWNKYSKSNPAILQGIPSKK